MRINSAAIAVSLAGVVLVQMPAAADEGAAGLPDPSIATSLPREFGDPGGVRSALAKHGILYGANYTGDVLGIVSGGVERSAHYAGLLEMYADMLEQEMFGHV